MREANQLQLRVVKQRPGSRLHGNVIRGLEGDEWEPGYVLTQTDTGRAATLPATIDANIDGPVKYVALYPFDGSANTNVPLEEIDRDTVCAAQIADGETATNDNIGQRGRLIQDATTGFYHVDLSATNDPSIEVVDAEPNYEPYGKLANDENNVVLFKFLDSVLDIAPPAVS